MRFQAYINKSVIDSINSIDENIECLLKEAPEGWTKSSVEKFAKSIGFDSAKDKGFFDACVARSKKHGMKDPSGFCAELKDMSWGTTKWRNKKRAKENK